MRFAGLFDERRTLASLARKIMATGIEWVSGRTVTFSLGFPLQLTKDAAIFEMGYGAGRWLRIMASLEYKNLYGYDLDANPNHTSGLQSAGINLSSGMFLENQYPEAHFDCIRLEHVFEHLLNPVDVLKKCHSMLKPGGFLVMNLPCKSSWSRSISSRHWGALEPPVHIFHYTPESARLMLGQAGFQSLGIKPYSVADQLAGTINNVIAARALKLPTMGGRVCRIIAPLYRLLGRVSGRGDFMTIWARA